MKKSLYMEFGREILVSTGIYFGLFLVLWTIETLVPSTARQLLRWSEAAFIVGIPANIIGTAYVLTIRNPKNYTGFIGGIVMSLLLAWQFYLQRNYDLMILYVVVFIPFMYRSLVGWRRATLAQWQATENGQQTNTTALRPTFMDAKRWSICLVVFVLLMAADYLLATYVMNHDALTDNIVVKIASGMTIASSFFANLLLIYKHNEAWICWVVFSIAGIVLFSVLGNIFSLALYVVFLYVNGSAQFAWLRITEQEDMGWAGHNPFK